MDGVLKYREAILAAQLEMVDLLKKRGQIEARIAQLKSAIKLLSGLLEEPPQVDEVTPEELGDLGITEAIRAVLQQSEVAMTPAEIKARLSEAKVNLDKYANASAVIHNTLKRMQSQGELDVTTFPGGAAAYSLRKESWGEGLARYIADPSNSSRMTLAEIAEKLSEPLKKRGGGD
jgi:hypothetical protein